jgi:hypothetical protein
MSNKERKKRSPKKKQPTNSFERALREAASPKPLSPKKRFATSLEKLFEDAKPATSKDAKMFEELLEGKKPRGRKPKSPKRESPEEERTLRCEAQKGRKCEYGYWTKKCTCRKPEKSEDSFIVNGPEAYELAEDELVPEEEEVIKNLVPYQKQKIENLDRFINDRKDKFFLEKQLLMQTEAEKRENERLKAAAKKALERGRDIYAKLRFRD